MEYLLGLLENVTLLTALAGWATAQLIKTLLYGLINREWRLERLVGSGGMPSSHAATVCALTTSALIHYGTASFEFTISVILTAVVLHDARGVRLETGKQAEIINSIMKFFRDGEAFKPFWEGDPARLPEKELKELVGHTPFQVAVGAVLGVVIALIIG